MPCSSSASTSRSGARTLIGTVGPADRSAVTEFGDAALAADLDHVAYAVVRQPSELYMIKIGR